MACHFKIPLISLATVLQTAVLCTKRSLHRISVVPCCAPSLSFECKNTQFCESLILNPTSSEVKDQDSMLSAAGVWVCYCLFGFFFVTWQLDLFRFWHQYDHMSAWVCECVSIWVCKECMNVWVDAYEWHERMRLYMSVLEMSIMSTWVYSSLSVWVYESTWDEYMHWCKSTHSLTQCILFAMQILYSRCWWSTLLCPFVLCCWLDWKWSV